MTDIVPSTDAPSAPVGLEDIGSQDLLIPRLSIVGEEAVFKDSLSNEKFTELNTVVLGLVKQRVLWEPEMKPGAKPLCRSRDGNVGLPQDGFPWRESGFEQVADIVQQELSCQACPLKEWGSDPKSKEKPWCTEQFVTVVYHEGGPALLTLQRTALAAVRAYANSFVRTQQPMFTKYATVTLTPLRTGSVRYAVPVFTAGELTPVEDHTYYTDIFNKARAFLQSVRRERSADDELAQAAVKEPRTPVAVDDTVEPF